MRGGLHKVCYDGAGDDAGESGQKGAGEGVSGFLDFGGYVVDAEGVEDGFGAAEDEGGGQADGGVGAVFQRERMPVSIDRLPYRDPERKPGRFLRKCVDYFS